MLSRHKRAGSAPAANGTGVSIIGDTTGVLIGGTAASARNVISGNSSLGIEFTDTARKPKGNAIVQGNYIGTDAAGAAVVLNQNPLALTGNDNVRIGGTAAGARNIILGAISIRGSAYSITGQPCAFYSGGQHNTVQGNYCGLYANGTPAPDPVVGSIILSTGSANNLLGGSVAAARNVCD